MDDGPDPDDLELQRPPEDERQLEQPHLGGREGLDETLVERERFPYGLAALAAATLGGAGVLLYLVMHKPTTAPLPPASPSPAVETSSASPSAPGPSPTQSPDEALELPSLDKSDALVGELLGRLSAHPQLQAWAGSDQLVRRFAVLVVNVVAGENTRPNLRYLEPRERLRVLARGPSGSVIDPQSFARFDGFAEAVASLDEAGCARVHRQLRPLFESAFRELGHPEGGFDRALAAAARLLLDVPVLEGDVAVRPVRRATLVYEYADPQLEALSLPQKQLLRMGPRNVRLLQAKLRSLSAAFGLQPGAGVTP